MSEKRERIYTHQHKSHTINRESADLAYKLQRRAHNTNKAYFFPIPFAFYVLLIEIEKSMCRDEHRMMFNLSPRLVEKCSLPLCRPTFMN